jgi:primosomal protein N' (replication factor Y)
VLIQTHYPGHPLLATLLRQDYGAFAELALAERKAAGWPPFVHLAAWQAEAADRDTVLAFLAYVKATAERTPRAAAVTLLGPASAVMERKDGRYRAHLLMQSGDRRALHDGLAATLAVVRSSREARRVRFAVDVDPLELC